MKMKIYTLGLLLCIAGSTFAQKKNATVYKAGTVTINGDLSEYDLKNTLTNSVTTDLACGITAQGPQINNTTTFGLLWDETSLYFGIKVVDAAVIDKDVVELFFSMLNEETAVECPENWPRAYTATEFQFLFTVNTVDGNPTISSPQGAEPAVVTPVGYQKTADGYNMEIQFLWEELDFFVLNKPAIAAPRVIGFDVFNTDWDNDVERTAQQSWNQCCSNRNWTESINFGTATLSDVTSTTDVNNVVSSMTLFPNPANTEKVSLNLTATSSETVTVSVVNALSESFYNKNVNLVPGENNHVELSTNEWANGVYYVLVSNGKSNKTQKLVVTK